MKANFELNFASKASFFARFFSDKLCLKLPEGLLDRALSSAEHNLAAFFYVRVLHERAHARIVQDLLITAKIDNIDIVPVRRQRLVIVIVFVLMQLLDLQRHIAHASCVSDLLWLTVCVVVAVTLNLIFIGDDRGVRARLLSFALNIFIHLTVVSLSLLLLLGLAQEFRLQSVGLQELRH